ncbi:MAG: glycosyltransferase, partial [Oscillospiraceae bacterium]|nr:glycosyltransferase [Oscillospiraceae bacterium]
AMDLFLMPSLFEGLPIVGVEAQAAGLPCVFSDRVTQAVKLTERADFISLEQPSAVWAQQVLKQYKDTPRAVTAEAVIKAGYDINAEANHLAQIYEKLVLKE